MTDQIFYEELRATIRDAIASYLDTYTDEELRELATESLNLPPRPTRWSLYWRNGDKQIVEGPDIATAMNCAGIGAGALAALDFYERGDGDHGYRWSAADRDWVKKDDPDLFG